MNDNNEKRAKDKKLLMLIQYHGCFHIYDNNDNGIDENTNFDGGD
jgi:hypothetical protein